ncbi:hypothetical protein C0995_000939 [Termitomyces sp. Mi166|nr:hypothetical protein C0995_000939 [Termitomyces sp. Mi166\
MASPSDFSRRSTSTQTFPYPPLTPKLSKAPQHNPYDKFTQDEFDAWIGGITSALKRALGQEDEVISSLEASSKYAEQSISGDEEEVERLIEFTGESSDEEAEASSSYLTVRRVSKGKARDPRDGPGFGKGNQSEPIFIGSDSEEENGDDEDDEVIGAWDSQSGEEEDDEKHDLDWADAESSVQARIRRETQTVIEVKEDNRENEEEDKDENGEEDEFEGHEQQGEDDEDDYEMPSPRQTSSPVLVVDSDEDEVHGTASQGHAFDETRFAMDYLNEDDTPLPSSTSNCVGPHHYRAKQHRHVSFVETTDVGVEEYEDIQPLENDTSFPPHETAPPANEDRSVELLDRWAGPETYAKDYYSGGDVREFSDLSVDFLGMEHEELHQAAVSKEPRQLHNHHQHPMKRHNEVPQAQDVIQLDVDEVDVQPLSEDTSFPPKIAEDNYFQSHQPINIPDPWTGPKTYAEDFYSGGDVRPLQNGTLDPHRLGNNDECVTSTPIPQQEANHIDETDRSEEQPRSNVDAADVPSNAIYESPQLDYTVELPEPWDRPINYEEDHSAEVEAKTTPQMIVNQSGVCNDGDTPIVIVSEDETTSVMPQDATAGTLGDAVKLAQEQSEESAERTLNHTEPLATSGPQDSSGPVTQVEDFNVLFGDITVTGEPQHSVHDQNQDDVPVLEWINDSAFTHDLCASPIADMGQSYIDASISESIQVDSNEEAVKEIAQKLDEGIDVRVPETQLETVEVFAKQTVEAIGQDPNEDHSEAVFCIQNTSETSKVATLPLPSASLGPTEVIEDASPIEHDQEPEITNLRTLAHDETNTGKSHRFEADIDPVLKDDPVPPGIEVVKETNAKVDVGDDEMPLDLDALSKLHRETSTQDTIVKCIKVLDEDPADVTSKGLNFEISEPVIATADSDNSGSILSELQLIVPPSVTPTMTEGLQSVSGNANTTSVGVDVGGFNSQIAPPSQENTLEASADLPVHTNPASTSQSQPLDPMVGSQSFFSIIEPTQAASGSIPDLTVMPPTSETSLTEITLKGQTMPDSLTAQGPIPVNSDMKSVPLDRQKVQLSSRLPSLPVSVPFPHPRPWVGSYPMNVVMHKASDPVLFADPYPASLSTPDDADRGYAMSYEQFLRRNFSSSLNVPGGSTAGRNVADGRIQNQIPVANDPAQDPYEEAPLLRRNHSVKVELASNVDSTLAKHTATLSSSPTSREFVADNTARHTYPKPSDEAALLQQANLTQVELTKDIELTLARPVATALSSSPISQDSDLNSPTNRRSTVFGSAVKDDGDENMAQQSSPLSSPVVEHANGVSTKRVRSPPLEDDLPSILIIKKVHADDQTPVKPKAGPSRKRKRSSSVTMTSLPRTGSSKTFEKSNATSRLPAKSRGSKGKASRMPKGKGKEVGVPPISQGSFDTQSISSRSSSDASAARRMLEPNSRGTSRASSIASTAPSDNSISSVQPSPTLGKGGSFRQPPPPPPPPAPVPLFHRHHHNRPQPSRPVLTQRASLSARQYDHASVEPSSSKQSGSTLYRHPTYSSSPVTRSNCRYHKISIPLDDESDEEGSGDEDVKLVYFLVPGCSLGNQELNREEKIVDHGDAQPSDGLLMTSDLDAYAFNAPLLSVLRLLVGVDMLREGEIYYLPLPGSDWVPRKVRDTSTKAHQSSDGALHVTPRRNSNMSISHVVNPPVSSHGSTSTLAPFRSMKPSSIISQTSSELTEVEDSPQSKRFKSSPVAEEGNARQVEPVSDARPKKSKHLGQDEYRLISQDEDDDADEHAIGRARSNRGNKHGLKRSRTSDVIQEPDIDGQKLKKQKTGVDLRIT